MKAIRMTYQLAHAAAWDAGNRSMRAAGRERWGEEDRDACAAEFERLWPTPKTVADLRRQERANRGGA